MADKKSKTPSEVYDERARSLMKAIDARRADRALDAPKRRLINRIREEEGRSATIGDAYPVFPIVDMVSSMISGRRPSPGVEYQDQQNRTREAVIPTLQGNPMGARREPWSGMMYDPENDEGLSGFSGTPGELLPPYRVRDARRVADSYEFSKSRHPEYADKLARKNIENLALDARKATPPVTQEDIDSMREMFVRPGETSNMRDYIDTLPSEAQNLERVLRADEAWRRAHVMPKKKGK